MNLVLRCILVFFLIQLSPMEQLRSEELQVIHLSKPKAEGSVSVEAAIQKRRSVRSYSNKEVLDEAVSQLLWACQGVTDKAKGLRASPSAGALYPLEIYLARKDGVYHYVVKGHKLEMVLRHDVRHALAEAAYGQRFVEEAPIDIVVCAVYERIMSKYGDRAIRYADMEAGHAAQNVFLQAVALGLDSVPVGAFGDVSVAKALGLPEDTRPLYILPVGYGANRKDL